MSYRSLMSIAETVWSRPLDAIPAPLCVGADVDVEKDLGRVFDHGTGDVYHLIKLLGEGEFGKVYSVSMDGSETPTHVLKKFTRRPEDNEAQLRRDVLQEFNIGWTIAFLGGRSDASFGSTSAVCAERVFFVEPGEVYGDTIGYVVFPFVHGISLNDFIEAQSKAKPSKARRDGLLDIARRICQAIHDLHVLGVYHCDIKPENILVTISEDGTRVTSLRLIDFGLSCVRKISSNLARSLDLSESISCEFEAGTSMYYTMSAFRDPRSGGVVEVEFADYVKREDGTDYLPDDSYDVMFPTSLVPKLWPLFETYSVAVTLAETLDHSFKTNDDMATLHRETLELSLFDDEQRDRIREMITEMVGPLDKRRSLACYARKFAGLAGDSGDTLKRKQPGRAAKGKKIERFE